MILKKKRFVIKEKYGRTELAFKYEGLETGADDYIQKPITKERLVNTLNCIIYKIRTVPLKII